MISDRLHQIIESMRDKDYRDIVVSEEIYTGLPFQIRTMRKDRGWTQAELANRAGMTQEAVSRAESLNYQRFAISTLQRLASAFDVALTVRFEPYSELACRMAHLSPEDLAIPGFDQDPGVHPPARAEQLNPQSDSARPALASEGWTELSGTSLQPGPAIHLEDASSVVSEDNIIDFSKYLDLTGNRRAVN